MPPSFQYVSEKAFPDYLSVQIQCSEPSLTPASGCRLASGLLQYVTYAGTVVVQFGYNCEEGGQSIMRRVFEVAFVVILIIVAFFTFRPQPPFPHVAGVDAALPLVQEANTGK